MKTNKKLGLLLVFVVLAIGIVGCSQKVAQEPLHIAALNGPTGIGIVQLLEKTDQYDIALYQNPDEIVGKVVSGELDIACVPSNMASVLYNKTEGKVELLGVNTLGVLYIVENGESVKGISDLKGKTLLASGKGSTPELILNYILKQNGLEPGKDVTVEFLTNHADIASKLMTEEGAVALLPEPFVTTVLAKNEKVKVALDLNAEWENLTQLDLPMGTIIVKKDMNQKALEGFVKDYTASVQFVNEDVEGAAKLVEAAQIVPSAAIAQKAIPKCNIVFKQGEEAKVALDAFYHILKEENVKAIGGKVPDESFYRK